MEAMNQPCTICGYLHPDNVEVTLFVDHQAKITAWMCPEHRVRTEDTFHNYQSLVQRTFDRQMERTA